MFTSSDDAWAGFATKYVEKLRDELGKGCIWVWGIDSSAPASEKDAEPRTKAQQREQAANTALALNGLSGQASMFVPLSVPKSLPTSVRLDRSSLWYSAGFLSAIVESAAMPTRLRESSVRVSTFRDWQDALGAGGRRTVAGLAWDLCDIPTQKSKDTRMQSLDTGDKETVDGHPETTQFACFPTAEATTRGNTRQARRRNKIFSRIESFRNESRDTASELASEGAIPDDDNTVLER